MLSRDFLKTKLLVSLLSSLIFVAPAFGVTDVTYTVGDGTSACAPCDYSDWVTAEATENRDISAATGTDERVTFEMYDTASPETAGVYIGGWSSDYSTNNYVIIRGASADITAGTNTGVWSTDRFEYITTTGLISMYDDSEWWDIQLQLNYTDTGNRQVLFTASAQKTLKVYRSLLVAVGSNVGNRYRVYRTSSDQLFVGFYNTAMRGSCVAGSTSTNQTMIESASLDLFTTFELVNNTMDQARYGIYLAGGATNLVAHNNWIDSDCGAGGAAWYIAGTPTSVDCSYNAVHAGEPLEAGCTNTVEGIPVFVDTVTTFNFHVDASDALLVDAGVDMSGYVTDDIDQQTRSGTYDIGADETVGGGAPPSGGGSGNLRFMHDPLDFLYLERR